jgi:hypothetical protein
MTAQPTYGFWGAAAGLGQATAAPQVVPSYLKAEKQAKVDAILGNSYDPTKPLNIQLFKAQWAKMTDAQKRAFAKKMAGQFIEGGPSVKTLSQFHNTYLQELNAQNADLQHQYDTSLANYQQTGGGFAQSKEQAQANIAYWKAFAASPEGQAHIAATGMTPQDWIKGQVDSMKAGLQNYEKQQQQFSHIQSLAQSLGIDVPGFTAPGWSSTLEGIQAGHNPLPSADYLAMYPGSAKDLVGVQSTYSPSAPHRPSDTQGTQATQDGFQPFTNFTGVQQPDTFSERDLYQSTQYR